jgi:hypothetical protein
VQHEDKRDEELRGAFLEKDTLHVLAYLGFGQRIWGEGSGAPGYKKCRDSKCLGVSQTRPPPYK